MRYAILSDIHANLEAFHAVLARTVELGADRKLCLGDVVGYHADPNACVDLVRSENIACVMGNHDAAACGIEEPDSFNPAARAAVLWTREVLTAENKEFLRGLPRHLQVGDAVLCHGSINDTDKYILEDSDVHENFAVMEMLPSWPQVCFYGHTHMKAAFSITGGVVSGVLSDKILLSSGTRYLINPGGVGQPRDGDPQSPFLIHDTADRTVIFHRVEYDIAACQRKVLRAGLPARLAERLAMGR
ncbi:MAG: metallophosphoesterase family protein [Nitrospirae bacterium]|nr:metallophosphoesterase family protein [Nitrospirota bacterium]